MRTELNPAGFGKEYVSFEDGAALVERLRLSYGSLDKIAMAFYDRFGKSPLGIKRDLQRYRGRYNRMTVNRYSELEVLL